MTNAQEKIKELFEFLSTIKESVGGDTEKMWFEFKTEFEMLSDDLED